MKKIFLFLSLLAAALLAMPGCKEENGSKQEAGLSLRGQAQPLNRFEQEILAFEASDKIKSPPQKALLFTGSSSIRLWTTLEQDFAPLPVINRGFGGSTLPEVTWYARRIIYKYKPSLIVLYCGENDIAENAPPPVAFQNFKKLIADKDKNLPGVPLFVLSAKPSPARWHLWGQYQQFNILVQEFCENRPDLNFTDISSSLLKANGEPDASLFAEDQLHLNQKGYEKWTSLLKPVLEEQLAQPASR